MPLRSGAEFPKTRHIASLPGESATAQEHEAPPAVTEGSSWPYPSENATAMLRMARESGLSIAQMKRANENHRQAPDEVERGLARLWSVMSGCIERGLSQDGELPGGLRVRRRAARIHRQLLAERQSNRV